MLVAGPSHAIYNNYLNSSSSLNNVRPQNSSSVITVSSTSSSSSVSSKASRNSNKYNLLKSVTNSIKSGTDLIKNTFLSKISSSINAPATVFTSTTSQATSGSNKNNLTIAISKPSESDDDDNDIDDDDDDVDSLKAELIHFKPIVPVPKTPTSQSKPKILRVPSIRPKSEASNPEIFSPCASPFIPIDPKSPRKSAFSIVSIHSNDSPKDKETLVVLSPKKGRRGRKRKIEAVIEECDNDNGKKEEEEKEKITKNSPKKRSNKRTKQLAVKEVVDVSNVRLTRNRKAGGCLYKQNQEKMDFEFAKELVVKLNCRKRGKSASNTTKSKPKQKQQQPKPESNSKKKEVIKSNYNIRSRRS